MSVEKCKSRALKYVAMQIRTEGQIVDYLRRKEFEPEEIEEAIAFLKECDYINDAYYCQCYYKESCRKGRGRNRIEMELLRKKVKRDVIRDAIDELLSEENPEHEELVEELLTEKERALKVARKMADNHTAEDKEIDKNFLAKVGRRLMSLGYNSGVVYGVIGTLMKEYRRDE